MVTRPSTCPAGCSAPARVSVSARPTGPGGVVAVGGTGVAVGGTGVAVGGTGVAVGGTGVAVGGTGVAVGGTGVAVGVGVTVPACVLRNVTTSFSLALTMEKAMQLSPTLF